MEAVLVLILVFVIGFAIGYLNKGINITYTNKEHPLVPSQHIEEVKQENDELTKLLDPEVVKWFQDNNGMIK